MGMSASQARFLQLTSRRTNVEYMGQQINQQRLQLANTSASLFEKMLSLDTPIPASSQDEKYYTQAYNFTDPRDGNQKKISWQTYDDAVASGSPTADSYYSNPAGLQVLSVADGTIHTYSPATIANPTDAEKADLLAAMGIAAAPVGYRQEIRYINIENPVFTPDGKMTTHNEQGLALLEFDNLNRLLKVTSLTDKEFINYTDIGSGFTAPSPVTSGAISGLANDGNKVAGAANPTIVYSGWAPSGSYVVDPATNTASQTYTRSASQQVAAGTIDTSISVVQQQITDLGSIQATDSLYGTNFNKYTYTDYAGVTQTKYAIGDVDATQAKAQLEALANTGSAVTDDFILMSDVDLLGDNWGVIDSFSGSFDGNLHTISNLSIASAGSASYQGMFGIIEASGSVLNTKLQNESIDIDGTGNYVGGIAGANVGTIENCSSRNLSINIGSNVASSAAFVGGIAGCSGASIPGSSPNNDNASITRSEVSGNIELNDASSYQIGGFSGWLIGGSVTFSSADVDIHNNNAASNYMSVFVSDLNSTADQPMKYCYATGDLNVNGAPVGGHSFGFPIGSLLTGDTDQHSDLASSNTINQSDIGYSSYIRNSSTGANYAVYQGTRTPAMLANLSSILGDMASINGVMTNVWNPDGTLNLTAVNTTSTSVPAHTTDNWTETIVVTAPASSLASSIPFSVGDGDALTYTGKFDFVAYNNDMNKYEYQKASYEYQIASLNKQTKEIQLQDKSLELKLKQLDTEHNAIQTELDAVQKVVQKNIESSFKTFA